MTEPTIQDTAPDDRDAEIAALNARVIELLNAAQRPGIAGGADRATAAVPPLPEPVADARDAEIAKLKAALAQATGQNLDGTAVEEPHHYTLGLACGDSTTSPNLWGTHHFCPDHGTVSITSASLFAPDAPKES